jgi:uncharacterized ion transporter superfamily protein YfcC
MLHYTNIKFIFTCEIQHCSLSHCLQRKGVVENFRSGVLNFLRPGATFTLSRAVVLYTTISEISGNLLENANNLLSQVDITFFIYFYLCVPKMNSVCVIDSNNFFQFYAE